MKKRLWFTLTVLAAFAFLASGAGAEVTAVLKAGGGAPGGAGFAMLTGMSKVVAKSYPKINITVVPGGWVGNVTRVDVGELQLASTANTLCQLAEQKIEPMNKDFKSVLLSDPKVKRRLSNSEIEACFDVKYYLRHVATIFKDIGL